MSAGQLWTVAEMAAAMGAERQGVLPSAIPGVSIDSRTVAPGEAFFALADRRDGHDFVDAALAAKAGLAVVGAERRGQFPHDAPLLLVPDVLPALRDLAAAARKRTNAKVIGVTGSVGKTSTKDALLLALQKEGEAHASVASYNNHWGVPLSLARCPASARYVILEMGMNHAGEIEPLSRLARPHVALITAIAPVHLEFFGTLAKSPTPRPRFFSDWKKAARRYSTATTRNLPIFCAAPKRPKLRASSRSGSTRKRMRGSSSLRCIRNARPSRQTFSAPNSLTKSARPAIISWSIRLLFWQPRSWSAPILHSRRSRSHNSSRLPAVEN